MCPEDPSALTRRHALGLGLAGAIVLAGPSWARPAARASSFSVPLAPAAAARAAGAWRIYPVVRPTRAFALLGLRWDPARAPAAVEARTRRRAGAWGPWTPLAVAAAHAPDGRARRATDPVWVGLAHEAQFRVRGGARSPHAAFVAVDRRRPHARVAVRRQAPAPDGVAPPPIILRETWDDGSAAPRGEPSVGTVETAFIHHTVGTNDYAPEESADIVMSIARYHRDQNGWDDIGYNLLVDRFGQVFEGRAGGLDQAIVGAHAQGWNSVSVGIACIGNFAAEPLPSAARDALTQLVAWKLSLHGVPVSGRVALTSGGGSANRYPRGEVVEFERISGHRDGDQTECPGGALYGALGDLRARAVAIAPAPQAPPPAALTIARTASRIAVGGEARVRGKAAPGATVRLVVQRSNGRRLTQAGQATSVRAGRDGRWSARLRLSRAGLHRITARAGATERAVYVRAMADRSGGVRAS